VAESPFRKAAMQQLADLLLPTIPESFQDLGQRAAGRAEVLATLGTGMAGSIPAGYGGLLELARTGDPQAAAQLTQEIQQGLTYMPRTEMGQEYLQGLGGPLEMLAVPSEAIGQAAFEATGSPLAAAGAETFGDPLEYLLPGLKGVMATAPLARRAMRASDGAMNASDIGLNVPDELLDQVAQEKIIAFHGSPYEFEKFDMSQIGTGEGAQAYGYGLYFAEAEDVAKGYREALTEPKLQFDERNLDTPWNNEIRDRWSDYYENLTEVEADAMDNILGNLSQANTMSDVKNVEYYFRSDPVARSLYQRVVKPKLREFKPEGATYRVEIDAKPEELLDWDKPLSEQPDVMDALSKLHTPQGMMSDVVTRYFESPLSKKQDPTGADLYKALTSIGGDDPKRATGNLNQLGIKGIKYADGMSRNKEGGTSNFVVFDDRLISIAEKYGVALPVAGAILYQLEQQSQPIESI
jgi:hypothetical protein